jgi:hypothetical protein
VNAPPTRVLDEALAAARLAEKIRSWIDVPGRRPAI